MTSLPALESLKYFLPESFLLIGAFVVLITDLFYQNKRAIGMLSLVILALAALLSKAPQEPVSLFSGFFTLDPLTHFFRLAALGMVAVTILASFDYKLLPKLYEGEYYSLFLFMAFGLILMGAATNLLMIFMSIEFVSVLSYLMTGMLKKDERSKEAAIKYLLFGSVASGLMLYGMSLLLGISGALDLDAVRTAVMNPAFSAVSMLGLILMLAGLGFKISMAPFHMWAPDVYEAAPTPVTGFLTVAPKALGFALLIRVLSTAFDPLAGKWQALVAALSILTMTVGNVTAIAQSNIKRLLAYSSIAQAGYIMMGLAAANSFGWESVMIYTAVYALTNLGAFIAVIAVSNHTGSDELYAYTGLAKRSPLLAASLTLFLLSLAGIPPLAGFIGKFFVFSSVIQSGFYSLAVAAALNSAVAAFYYFKIVKAMYLAPPEHETSIPYTPALSAALFLTLAGVLFVGFFPSSLIQFVQGLI